MKSLTVEELCQAVDGKIIGALDNVVFDVIIDSRKVKKGDLFVAIKGENFDGHDYVSKAFEQGANCAFSNQENISVPVDKTMIIVQDTKKALGQLAAYYIEKNRMPVVAVTGSVGKTTTKDIIASVLAQKYSVLKTIGNFNNDIGLPLTIFSAKEENNMAVLEMGMNSFGEISYLSKLAKPDVAVITNIGVSHIENLGSQEGILKAKLEIFDYISKDGIAVLNGDDKMLVTAPEKIDTKIEWFGIENKSGVYAENIEEMGLKGIACDIHTSIGDFKLNIPIPGVHMVLNALSATIVGLYFGLTLEQIKKGIEDFQPTKMRMAISKTKSNANLINDAYNANPVSMKAAIDVLASTEGETLAVLGDMFELGEFACEMHAQVGEYAAYKKIHTLVCIGENSIHMYNAAIKNNIKEAFYFENIEKFMIELDEIINNKNTILLKASRGMYFEKIVDKIQEVE